MMDDFAKFVGVLNEAFGEADGSSIGRRERREREEQEDFQFSLVYGEVVWHPFSQILQYCDPSADKCFVDLGSGCVGKYSFINLN